MLGLDDREAVLGHPVSRWRKLEGFVIGNLLSLAPERTQACFYRTSAGAEIDLVLDLAGGKHWAVEIKRSLFPSSTRDSTTPAQI